MRSATSFDPAPIEPVTPADNTVTPPMIGDAPKVGGVAASGFKIVEDESPRPLDRVFFTFNYFDNLTPRTFQQQFKLWRWQQPQQSNCYPLKLAALERGHCEAGLFKLHVVKLGDFAVS